MPACTAALDLFFLNGLNKETNKLWLSSLSCLQPVPAEAGLSDGRKESNFIVEPLVDKDEKLGNVEQMCSKLFEIRKRAFTLFQDMNWPNLYQWLN
jgi:hypothetical protein